MSRSLETPVPDHLLADLARAMGDSTGHRLARDGSRTPGGSFEQVLCWLWRRGEKGLAAEMVAGVLAVLKTQDADPHRLTEDFQAVLSSLITGISSSHWGLRGAELEAMHAYLRQTVSAFTGIRAP